MQKADKGCTFDLSIVAIIPREFNAASHHIRDFQTRDEISVRCCPRHG